MEQRIGSSSQPLEGAGFDPAFIPGLTSPVSGEPADARPEEPKGEVSDEAGSEEPGPKASDGSDDSDASEVPGVSDVSVAESPETDEEPDGPVFEASDRRAKIVADHKGVRLTLDDQACEFRWDEIGAVETEVPRFGKRLTITVHTPDRRWYPIEIEATSRSRFTEWDEQLDAVLDEYFEDGDEESADEVAEDAEVTEEENGGAAEKAEAGEPKAAKSEAAKSEAAKSETAKSETAKPKAEASDEKDAD
ncbi:hypothetical protein AB0H86_15985 [Streptomyces sp. NPDC050997]|uniref:hypothetical protein n=1 Tax=Streptomyces sp. NPDC050997 TaxID=3155519 RepID=UPI003440126E